MEHFIVWTSLQNPGWNSGCHIRPRGRSDWAYHPACRLVLPRRYSWFQAYRLLKLCGSSIPRFLQGRKHVNDYVFGFPFSHFTSDFLHVHLYFDMVVILLFSICLSLTKICLHNYIECPLVAMIVDCLLWRNLDALRRQPYKHINYKIIKWQVRMLDRERFDKLRCWEKRAKVCFSGVMLTAQALHLAWVWWACLVVWTMQGRE